MSFETENNRNIKGIIFDLDGTLLNTISDITDALNYSLTKNKLPNVTIEEAKYLVGNGAKILIERTINKVCSNMGNASLYINDHVLFDNVYNDYMFSYNLWKFNKTLPYQSVVKTLHILRRKGIKLAVLSNKPERDTQGVVKKFFPNEFDIVRGSRENVPLKPDPTAVNEIIQEIGLLKDEVIYVGDSNVDILTSKNAGLFGVGACYGFRQKKELIECGADYTINSMHDLLNLFSDEPNGILILDKPYKMSSQEAITKVKKALGVSKIGHAGTLDPLATGVLVVLLQDATKLSNYLLNDDKTYVSEITLGIKTDTLDCEGKIIDSKPLKKEDYPEELIDTILEKMVGKISLEVPIHSAIKVNGKKLYDLARSGKEADLPVKENTIYDIKRCSEVIYDNDKIVFSFNCHVSKGTYIRKICEEIGNRLNVPSYMTGLRRTSSGNIKLDDAYTLDDIKDKKYKIISVLDAIKDYKQVEVNDFLYNRVNNGMPIRLKDNDSDDLVFITYKGKLVGIYQREEGISYKAKRIWK